MLTASLPASTHRRSLLRRPSQAASVQFELHAAPSAGRANLQSYIAERYALVHGAQVTEFLPLLLAMQGANGPVAALGLRPGCCGPMFLEHYLDERIEQTIAEHARQPVFRGTMVEIGNLVATSSGSSQLLFVVLTAALAGASYRWMVFTGTPQVKKLINRLNYNPIIVGSADPRRLGENSGNWGTYYNTGPKVMAGSVPEAMAALHGCPHSRLLLAEYQAVIETVAQSLRDHRRLCGFRHGG